MPATYNLNMYQGDTYTLTLTIGGDYSSHTHALVMATNFSAGSTLTLNTASGITDSYDATTELTTVVITATATQTAALSDSGDWIYDYSVTSGAVVTTLMTGLVVLTPQVGVV